MTTAVMDERVAKKVAKQPEPDPTNRKPMVVQIRGTLEYKAWAEKLAESDGFSLAMMFDRAVRQYAKSKGFPDPPKR